MAVPRTKKKKQPGHRKPAKTPLEIVTLTNYLNLAVMVRTLHMVYGWRSVRLNRFMESYCALMDEIATNRSTVLGFIRDTKELTGVDVEKLLDEVYK